MYSRAEMTLNSFIQKRARLIAFILWFIAFMSPLYVQWKGFVYDQRIVWEILSSSVIYNFTVWIWPSLILHLLAYSLLFLSLKNLKYVKYFILFSSLEYLMIGAGQSTAITRGGVESLISNLILIVLVGLLWLRDTHSQPNYEGKGPSWFLPLALFSFIAPGAASSIVPPWFWMWKIAASQPLYVIPALLGDAFAGFGAVAYCLFTPLAITLAGRYGAIRPLTLRLTSLLGVAFSSIIIGSSLIDIYTGALPIGKQLPVIWNAVLHIPLLITCTYYFLVRWPPKDDRTF